MIHLTDDEMRIILAVLKVHAVDCDVFIFGSRYGGLPKKFSDVDLAFAQRDGEKLSLSRRNRIALAFSESDLPYLVDVVDYHSCHVSFQAIIDQHCKQIYPD